MNKIKVVKGFGFYFRGFDKFVNLLNPRWLYKIFVKEKYDLEVAFQIGIPTKCISVSLNPHRICWMHTYDAQMKFKKYYQEFPFIVNVAKAGYEKILAEGFEPKKNDYCYNIIDETAIIEKAKEVFDYKKQKELAVVTVARHAPDKGFMRYLQCIKEISKKINNVEFWIVGGGPDEEKMRQYIKENGLEDAVIMFGKQSNPFKIVSNADLYFCCSYREGFSTSCQEAALLGIPVVSVLVDGANELIEISSSGSVIPNDDQSIVENLTNILQDNDQIEKWKEYSMQNRNRFFKKARLEKVLSVLQKNMDLGE